MLLGVGPTLKQGSEFTPIRWFDSTSPCRTHQDIVYVELYQFEDRPDLVIVDAGEPLHDFPQDCQEVVRYLRDNGRLVLAGDLEAMLKEAEKDPDFNGVDFVSLRSMARLLVREGHYADPFMGPDWDGIVYSEWRIPGNGLLAWGFLESGELLSMVQADAVLGREKLHENIRGLEEEVLRKHGYLVPLRNN